SAARVRVAGGRRWVCAAARARGDLRAADRDGRPGPARGRGSLVTGVAVGRLTEIWRYPVKSMAGESLPRAEVSWQGLAGDRRWAFIRPGIPRSGFSWLTIHQQPRMWHYRPWFAEPGDPDHS